MEMERVEKRDETIIVVSSFSLAEKSKGAAEL
jgi:hypothetical protein